MATKPRIIIFRSLWGWSIAALVGAVSSILLLHAPGLPMMPAAQITAGTMGLTGGLACAFIISRAVGKMSRLWAGFLAMAWTVSCVLGISPLFLTSGTPQMMTALAFYSFAVFGALGGLATVYALKSLLRDNSSRDAISAIALWSFGFGLASLASNFVGDGLSGILPAWVAWAMAYEVMALIIGLTGGYAILRYIKTSSRTNDPVESVERGRNSRGDDQRSIIILTLLCLPFYLNDLADIFISDWRVWLAVDYLAVKLFPLLIIVFLVRSKKMALAEFGLTTKPDLRFLSVFFIAVLIGSTVEQTGYLVMNEFVGPSASGKAPVITSPLWQGIDLTFGLLMTGVCEELVFRGYLQAFLSRYTKRTAIIIAVSSLAFALIHWHGGYEKVMVTFAVGAFFMLLYLRTRTLPAIMLAHFAIDVIDFSHLMPKFLFMP